MRPVWYFVGWILVLIGAVVVCAGIYNLYNRSSSAAVVENLHPDLWWGAILMVAGVIYVWVNKDV